MAKNRRHLASPLEWCDPIGDVGWLIKPGLELRRKQVYPEDDVPPSIVARRFGRGGQMNKLKMATFAALPMVWILAASCEPTNETSDVANAEMPAGDLAAIDQVETVADLSTHPGVCKSLCAVEAECGKSCDYNEEPGCDEQKNYDFIYADCLGKCIAGEPKVNGACPEAALQYALSQQGKSCEAVFGDACAYEQRRYNELCVTEPGDWVCFHFCSALEVGCLPYELVGFRGGDCDKACMEQAKDLQCLEAHYQLDECMGTHGYACGPFPATCTAQVQDLDQKCAGWAATTADAAERSACATYAPLQCQCGLFTGDSCVELATERCLYQFGNGLACQQTTQAFYECMEGIQECNRDLLRETCLDDWDAYYEACQP